MNKCTNPSQVKRLMAAGLDPNTCDLYWCWDNGCARWVTFGEKDTWHTLFPAWTLSALLDIMPPSVQHNGKQHDLTLYKWHDPELDEDRYEVSYIFDGCSPIGLASDHRDPVSAAVDVVLGLLSQGLIEKGGSDEQ